MSSRSLILCRLPEHCSCTEEMKGGRGKYCLKVFVAAVLKIYYVYARGVVAHLGQRPVYGSHSAVWVSGIEQRSSGLVASAFTF